MNIKLHSSRRRTISFCFLTVSALLSAIACQMPTGGAFSPRTSTAPSDVLVPAPAAIETAIASALQDIYFPFAAADVDADERLKIVQAIPAIADILHDFPRLVIVLEGHCDDRGSTAINQQLGRSRAESVQRIFVAEGIPATHLRVVSYGEVDPVCSTQDETCRQRNRRVHFTAAQRPPSAH